MARRRHLGPLIEARVRLLVTGHEHDEAISAVELVLAEDEAMLDGATPYFRHAVASALEQQTDPWSLRKLAPLETSSGTSGGFESARDEFAADVVDDRQPTKACQ